MGKGREMSTKEGGGHSSVYIVYLLSDWGETERDRTLSILQFKMRGGGEEDWWDMAGVGLGMGY